MKKFLFLSYGFEPPTPEVMQAWGEWFAKVGPRIVAQEGLGSGRLITRDGVKDVTRDSGAATGYLIFTANDLAEAEAIARSCPIIASNLVQEIVSMKDCES